MTEGTAGRYVGARVHRLEDPRLLTGRGSYIDDQAVPGMLHAAFVRSPVARGSVSSVDVAAALAMPGVAAVFTMDDFRDIYQPTFSTIIGRGAPTTPLRPLADGDVRFAGDPIAIVIAESRYLAEDAAEAVDVELEPLPPVLDIATGLSTEILVHPETGSNLAAAIYAPADDEHAFGSAAHVVTETVAQHRYVAVPMEGRGLVASWEAGRGELTIWAATQAPHEMRSYCARMLGLPEHRVRVVMGDVGGGFGQKMFVTREEMAVVLASYLLGRPVRWIEDRSENLMVGGHARQEQATVSIATDGDGHLLAARVLHLENVGSYSVPGTGSVGGGVAAFFPGPYRLPLLSFTNRAVYTNTCGRCAYRGPWLFETVAREQMMDIVARAVGTDPLSLRRLNVITDDDLPYTSATGVRYDRISPAKTLEQAAELIGYEAFRREQPAARADGRYLGIGLSLYVEPIQTRGPLGSEGAIIRIDPTGEITLIMGTASHGQSLETTMAQIVADVLGCRPDSIAFIQGDTAVAPWGPGTGGSKSAVIAAGAAQLAAERMRDKMLRVAGYVLEVSADDLELSGGRIQVKGDPEARLSFGQLAEAAYLNPAALPADIEPGLLVSARSVAPAMVLANACHACTVEVDMHTGVVTILRYVVSEDCGPMINPMVVEGQIAGGVAQGIGGVLFEHMIYDGDGNPLTTTFMDYLLPTACEIPDVEYGHVVTPADTPGGYKGVGEGGAIGSPPAVINAVADALAPLGARITGTPLGPSQVLAAIAAGALGS
ncbi:MAG TPA: xanthine dehydrogenase family protein molybdopterin-binding subunit [Streptosporangiaceae bacterium]|nr:xanthine dehydrogenase family protein molybdopterin-binding subunit [Streptosporangiaceae bacterium]